MNQVEHRSSSQGQATLGWARRYWFLGVLIACLAVGLTLHRWLAFLVEWSWLQGVIVFCVMLMMALPIPWLSIRTALGKPWPAILGSLVNMFAVPAIAWGFSQGLPKELAGGLIVASLVPCTIASAAVWTRKAAGDDTIAVLITLLTNFACVVLTPIGMYWLLDTEVQLSVAPLILNLGLLVIFPILLAQGLRRFRTVQRFALDHKASLGIACQLGILSMVLIGAIQMGSMMGTSQSAGDSLLSLLLVCVVVAAVHVVAFCLGWYLGKWSGIPAASRIGVAFGGSQKTLMIGLKLAIDAQVSILPMVAYHVLQLLIDAVIASKLSEQSEAEKLNV